jgi:hypothetical protein
LKKILAALGVRFVSPSKVARIEASTEMPQILHEWEENHFERIATGDESWV